MNNIKSNIPCETNKCCLTPHFGGLKQPYNLIITTSFLPGGDPPNSWPHILQSIRCIILFVMALVANLYINVWFGDGDLS